MKKLAALLLTLIMLLAAVPALGDGPSGNWYMNLAEVTLGYIFLNEDGTAVVNIASEEDMQGTWSAEGDAVTVTVGGDPLTFAYDGESLSAAEFPLALSRTEGKLPMSVVTSMMGGEEYTLPEGMTDADVAVIAMNFLSEYTNLMQQQSDSAAPAAPPEEAKVTILQENFRVIPSYSGFSGVYIAKVKNETEAPVFITDGSMKLTDKSGNAAGEAKYLYPTGSLYLEPGEISFISMQADMTEDVEVDVDTDIVVKYNDYRDTDIAMTVENPTFVKGKGEYDSDMMRVTVANSSDAPLPGIEAAVVLEDAEGNLLYMATESLYRYELGPNSTITLVSSVDNRVRDYLAANGIEPVAVEAIAWVENN